MLRKLRKSLDKFFKSKLYKQLETFFTCIKGAVSIVKNIKGFIAAVVALSTGPPGVIEFTVKAICNWEAFEKVVTLALVARKVRGDARWHPFGMFIGQLVVAVGGFSR